MAAREDASPTSGEELRLSRRTANPSQWQGLNLLDEGFDTPIWGKETLTELLAHIKEHYGTYEIAAVTAGGKELGLYGFLPLDCEHPSAVETLIYLHPGARGRGLAQTLILASGATARRLGIFLFADVRTTNARSIHLHETLLVGEKSTLHDSPHGYQTRRWLLTGLEAETGGNPLTDATITAMLQDLRRDFEEQCAKEDS